MAKAKKPSTFPRVLQLVPHASFATKAGRLFNTPERLQRVQLLGLIEHQKTMTVPQSVFTSTARGLH